MERLLHKVLLNLIYPMDALKNRILQISYSRKLSHIGSCLTALPIIEEIYETKKPEERFVLSSGHAALALYVVLESKGGKNAEEIFNHHGVHPDRCGDCGIDCSTGSLGNGLPIAVGMALADRSKNVYCLISDGECSEGSIWEALRIAKEQNLNNLKVYCNCNGFGAYKPIDIDELEKRIQAFDFPVEIKRTNMNDWPDFLQDQQAHYMVMSEDQYGEILKAG